MLEIEYSNLFHAHDLDLQSKFIVSLAFLKYWKGLKPWNPQ